MHICATVQRFAPLPIDGMDIMLRKYGLCTSSIAPRTKRQRLKARSWGASTPMKMCIQAVLDSTRALRHMDKNNSERPVCTTHPLASISTSFLFIFDTEWVMSTSEHQGRDTVLQTGLISRPCRFWSGSGPLVFFKKKSQNGEDGVL